MTTVFNLCVYSSNPVVEQFIQSVFVDTFDQQSINGLTSETIRTQLTQLASDAAFLDKVASLKSTVLRKKECLSHGLLSTATVGVKDGDVKVNEFEVLFQISISSAIKAHIIVHSPHSATSVNEATPRPFRHPTVIEFRKHCRQMTAYQKKCQNCFDGVYAVCSSVSF
jgi:hypothetical protein